MTISIGIRAMPKTVFYCVLKQDGARISLESCSKLIVPIAFSSPERFKFIRTTFLDIIYEFGVSKAGIKITEPFSKYPSNDRIALEAVLQELLASSSVEKYFVGQISNISSRLDFPRDHFKKYVNDELNFESVEAWHTYKKEEKESILVGLASLKL